MAEGVGSLTTFSRKPAPWRRYISELNKPRIRLPSIVGFVAAVGVGLVVGRVIP